MIRGLTLVPAIIVGGAFALCSYTQVTFQKTFGGAGTDYAYALQQTIDGGYIIAGYTEGFGEGSRDLYVIRTGSDGSTIWTKTYGSNNTDYAWSVDQTSDGGFILGAHTGSFGAGGHDILLMRINSNGDELWSKVLGGPQPDGVYSLQQTFDGGFIIGAHTSSFGAGQHDYYLVKTDESGEVSWTKTFGGAGGDFLRAIDLTPDQGFIIVGESYSFGAGGADIYVVRTDMLGDTLWTKSYGGAGDDFGYDIQLTNDQAYVICGHTRSFGKGQLDALMMKIDDHGDLVWSKTYGGPDEENGLSVSTTDDGGFILVGSTKSFALGGFCDVLCNDVYLIKTDRAGDTLWTRAFGSMKDERGWSVQPTFDGGYAIVGITTGFGAGQEDIYFIKTDSSGQTGCAEKNTSTIVGNPAIESHFTTTTVSSGGLTDVASFVQTNPATMESTVCLTTSAAPGVPIISGVRIYPNPVIQTLYVEFNLESDQTVGFRMLDLSGACQWVLLSQNFHEGRNKLSLHDLPIGLFMLQIVGAKSAYVQKIIVVR